jgi:hypothetical protein
MVVVHAYIAKVFYWPDMRTDVCNFVRQCQDCQRTKPAQDSRVGLHSSEVVTRPLERIFIDCVDAASIPQRVERGRAAKAMFN